MRPLGRVWLTLFLSIDLLSDNDLAVAQLSSGQNLEQPTHGLCENITVQLCMGIGYNETIMPNILGHATQASAGHDLDAFLPLVKVNCSPDLNIFLCSLYVPVCTILTRPIPPCRSICIQARDGCSELMGKFGYMWPPNMACEKFPNPPELCVGPDKSPSSSGSSSPGRGSDTGNSDNNPGTGWNNIPKVNVPHIDTAIHQQTTPFLGPNANGKPIKSYCPKNWTVDVKQKYQLRMADNDLIDNCGLPCHNVWFTRDQESFARIWVGVWAMLCFISTLFTVLTFLIDMRRFKYPERPIIFISGCYFVVSLCYVVGFALEDKASCTKAGGGQLVVTQGTKNEGCTILFMLTYFFTMASSIWWVILTLTWVLAAGLKWGHEAIESNSQYFHLAAWAVPAIKTITIIALGSIDGDVLSGVCFTGLSDRTSLIGYIIAPLVVYLSLGTIFLIAGFISLFNIRNAIKHTGTKTNKLEKLMVRIGIFSVLYTVPAIIVIACNMYELLNRDIWLQQFRHDVCTNIHFRHVISCPITDYVNPNVSKGPNLEFTWFIFKYLGYLVVGITSGFWIWSNKTMASWGTFFNRLCCWFNRRQPEVHV